MHYFTTSNTSNALNTRWDYYPFGMEMPGRQNVDQLSGPVPVPLPVSYNLDYRYAYNGMETDGEVSGDGNSYTTEFRQYDPRIGRWKSLDPLMHQFPWMSPYVAFDNNPVFYVDPYGLAATNGGEGDPVKGDTKTNPKTGSTHTYDGTNWVRNVEDVVVTPSNQKTYIAFSREHPKYLFFYEKYGWDRFDPNVKQGSGANAEYNADAAQDDWMIDAEGFSGQVASLVNGTLDVVGLWFSFGTGVITAAERKIIQEAVERKIAQEALKKAGKKTADDLAESAAKDVRNGHLAGKVHPKTGVPFDKAGFPDFSGNLYKGGLNDVMIKPTGNRLKDFAAANKAAGYSSTPKGFTWHHHQTTGRMQLVESSVHSQTGHTGGFSLWEY